MQCTNGALAFGGRYRHPHDSIDINNRCGTFVVVDNFFVAASQLILRLRDFDGCICTVFRLRGISRGDMSSGAGGAINDAAAAAVWLQWFGALQLLQLLQCHLLREHFPFATQPVRLALVVVVEDFQAKIRVALQERRPNVGYVVRPATAECAKHDVGHLVVLQPRKLFQPIGPKTTAFA